MESRRDKGICSGPRCYLVFLGDTSYLPNPIPDGRFTSLSTSTHLGIVDLMRTAQQIGRLILLVIPTSITDSGVSTPDISLIPATNRR